VFAIDSRDLRHGGRDLMEAVSGYGTAVAHPNQAIVSLVGEGLRSDPGLVSRVFEAIDEIELGAILQGPSAITMSFVVGEAEVETVIARLHEVFFRQLDPRVFE
jgi:aspartate kinase